MVERQFHRQPLMATANETGRGEGKRGEQQEEEIEGNTTRLAVGETCDQTEANSETLLPEILGNDPVEVMLSHRILGQGVGRME